MCPCLAVPVLSGRAPLLISSNGRTEHWTLESRGGGYTEGPQRPQTQLGPGRLERFSRSLSAPFRISLCLSLSFSVPLRSSVFLGIALRSVSLFLLLIHGSKNGA